MMPPVLALAVATVVVLALAGWVISSFLLGINVRSGENELNVVMVLLPVNWNTDLDRKDMS